MKNILYYHIDPSIINDRIKYTFNLIFNTVGISTSFIKEPSQLNHPIDLYYGNSNIDSYITIRHNSTETCNNPKNTETTISNNKVIISTDLINSILFYIADAGNQQSEPSLFDKHDRLLFEETYQYKHGIHRHPIVNVLVNFIENIIRQAFPSITLEPKWPEGKKGAILLSHDVDYPQKYASLKNFFKVKTSKTTTLKRYLSFLNIYRQYITDKNRNEFWLFEKVLEEEAKHGFKSTFFFASQHKYCIGASSFDVEYDITGNEFVKVFKSIKMHGSEIGLHASYNAYHSEKNFIEEKKKLESIANTEVIGIRHHYWHLGRDIERTQKMHNIAGFKYDTSLAFNYNLGFRYNVALPFYPYSNKENSAISCLQLPTFCMDAALFDTKETTVNSALNRLVPYIDEVVALDGIGAIDWHDYTSFPTKTYGNMGHAYLKLLDLLATKYKNTWVTSCKDAYEWIINREKKINQVQNEENY